MDRFSNISDYGLIGNCRTAALVSTTGSIDWCCFPYFDSPSYFGGLLDPERGGHFSLSPAIPFTSTQEYLKNTNVLVTTFKTSHGEVRLFDSFSVNSEGDKKRALLADYEILRRVEGVSGIVPMILEYHPRPHYAERPSRLVRRGKLGVFCECGRDLLVLQTSLEESNLNLVTKNLDSELRADFEVRANEFQTFSLVYSMEGPAVLPPIETSGERLDRTIRYWREWISKCHYRGEFENEVYRSALALKLMIFAPSGAIVAAPTTSLPEWIGGERNWDYRYCWLRDASFTVRALMELGYFDEAEAFVYWMIDTGCGHDKFPQILYTLFGGRSAQEKELKRFSGYRGSKPVRVGNAAHDQLQIDVLGEVIDSIWYLARTQGSLDNVTKRFVIALANKCLALVHSPDEGIWEQRSGRAHHTHSKVLAWVALDRFQRMAERFHWKIDLVPYQKAAEELRKKIEAEGYDRKNGSYTQTFGKESLDASILTFSLYGYCEAISPRMQSSMNAIRNQLSKNGLFYRYREVNDGLSGNEGTFTVCTFWYIENLIKSGRTAEARQHLRMLLARGNTQGLWSEEIDPETGHFLGNYPQAFSHVGLINTALTLESSMKEAAK